MSQDWQRIRKYSKYSTPSYLPPTLKKQYKESYTYLTFPLLRNSVI